MGKAGRKPPNPRKRGPHNPLRRKCGPAREEKRQERAEAAEEAKRNKEHNEHHKKQHNNHDRAGTDHHENRADAVDGAVGGAVHPIKEDPRNFEEATMVAYRKKRDDEEEAAAADELRAARKRREEMKRLQQLERRRRASSGGDSNANSWRDAYSDTSEEPHMSALHTFEDLEEEQEAEQQQRQQHQGQVNRTEELPSRHFNRPVAAVSSYQQQQQQQPEQQPQDAWPSLPKSAHPAPPASFTDGEQRACAEPNDCDIRKGSVATSSPAVGGQQQQQQQQQQQPPASSYTNTSSSQSSFSSREDDYQRRTFGGSCSPPTAPQPVVPVTSSSASSKEGGKISELLHLLENNDTEWAARVKEVRDEFVEILAEKDQVIQDLKDKNFQLSRQLRVDLQEWQTLSEETSRHAQQQRDAAEKAKADKKEIQRLRSALGEAESKLDRSAKEKDALKREVEEVRVAAAAEIQGASSTALEYSREVLQLRQQVRGLQQQVQRQQQVQQQQQQLQLQQRANSLNPQPLNPSNPRYRRLASQVRRAIPCLSEDEALRLLASVRASHKDRLSGLPFPYIVREVARLIPADDSRLADFVRYNKGASNAGRDDDGEELSVEEEVAQALVKKVIAEKQAATLHQVQEAAKKSVQRQASLRSSECSICLESMESGGRSGDTIRLNPCSHMFHIECVRQWLKEKRDCPLCRNFTILHDEYPTLQQA